MPIEALRTPDARFENLPEWPYAPRYLDDLAGYEGLRVHFIDEGPRDARHTFLCLHGEPSWSFLYRKMIPVFLESGARVVALDFLGFGRSDKPVDDAVYTFQFHRELLLQFLRRLELTNLTLVVQDWGGLLGLTIPVDMPERVARLLIMNTAFPTGTSPSPGFLAWRDYAKNNPDMEVGALFARGNASLTPAEVAGYDAPFPDARYKAGVRRFPQLVPVADEAADAEVMALGRAARDFWSSKFDGKSFMGIGMADPVLGPKVMERVHAAIRGCPEPMRLQGVGHFVQDHGAPLARAALEAWGDLTRG
jgi:pimeloyl-ACP methyl ester carboxylesterase